MIQTVMNVATAYNTLNAAIFEHVLAPDFVYESQHVFGAMEGKATFITYIQAKYEAIEKSGALVYAEIGFSDSDNDINLSVAELMQIGNASIIIAQGSKENKSALLMLEFNTEGKISRMDMCTISPNWRTAKRTGLYPGSE